MPLNNAAAELTSAAVGAVLPEHLKLVSRVLPVCAWLLLSCVLW